MHLVQRLLEDTDRKIRGGMKERKCEGIQKINSIKDKKTRGEMGTLKQKECRDEMGTTLVW